MRKMYLLSGITGDYEDEYTWRVGVFYCKKKAEKRCKRLNALLEKYKISTDSERPFKDISFKNISFDEMEKLENRFKKLDKNFGINFFTGVSYFIEEVKVYDEYTQNKGDNS